MGDVELPSIGYPVIQNWNKATNGNPDYFNSCSIDGSSAIPQNYPGFQYPRTGNAYLGVFVTSGDGYHEYLQTKLINTLLPDHNYYVGYWISLINAGFTNVAGTDKLGVLFKSDSIETGFTSPILSMYSPQVISPDGYIFIDTFNWMPVSGSFKATGDERWMILGSFLDDTALNFHYFSDDGLFYYSYYYYEDICVLDMDGPIVAVNDIYICSQDYIDIRSYLALDSNYSFWNGDSLIQNIIIDSTGTYPIRIIDKGNCFLKDYLFTVDIGDKEIEIGLKKDTMICPNTTIYLDAYNELFQHYNWSTGDTTSGIWTDGIGTYTISATGDCVFGNSIINISEIPLSKVALGNDTIICKGSSISLTPSTDLSNIISYAWNTGSAECCIAIVDSGQYILTAEDVCNRMSNDTIIIDLQDCQHCILMPNAFSPNGDGINDEFNIIVNCEFDFFDFIIVNRWGNIVYRTANPNDKWNGTYNGEKQDIDVYFYIIKAIPKFEYAETIILKGEITLIR